MLLICLLVEGHGAAQRGEEEDPQGGRREYRRHGPTALTKVNTGCLRKLVHFHRDEDPTCLPPGSGSAEKKFRIRLRIRPEIEMKKKIYLYCK